MIEGACFVKISISISFVCFSLSDLAGKFTFLSPWHSFSLWSVWIEGEGGGVE